MIFKSIDNKERPTGQKQQLLDGRAVENKGKTNLTEIFPSVQNMIFKSIDYQSILNNL